MRTLAISEIEQVGGGVLPVAIVPILKAAAPIVATVATAATTIAGGMTIASSIERAIDKAAEACKSGSAASVQSLLSTCHVHRRRTRSRLQAGRSRPRRLACGRRCCRIT